MTRPNSAEDAVIVATVLIEAALNRPSRWRKFVDENVQTKIVGTSSELARCIRFFTGGTL